MSKKFIEPDVILRWDGNRLLVKSSGSPLVAVPQELLRNEYLSGVEDVFDWASVGQLMLDELTTISLEWDGKRSFKFILQTGAMKPVMLDLEQERAEELLAFLFS